MPFAVRWNKTWLTERYIRYHKHDEIKALLFLHMESFYLD
ncbi:hypothetical protein PAE4_20822 [Bacillus altitudinis]|nr:hypothetical protein US8_02826 [Bacillus altitudinis]SPR93401.1 hypothetical protein PAE4_20822 [Bacillus altitudinis]